MTGEHTATAAESPVTTLAQALSQSDEVLRSGANAGRVWPTGFFPLDQHLTGGVREGELVLLAGVQGLGKTTFALQLARNIAAAGRPVLYVCYEHSRMQLAERLLILEAGLKGGSTAITMDEARSALDTVGGGGYRERLGDRPEVLQALEHLELVGERLHLLSARADTTTLADIKQAAQDLEEPPILVVDYLQKVTLDEEVDDEVRIARVATGLKDLALDLAIPVVAIAAVERHSDESRRARVDDLKGSVTLGYEADIIMMLNEKYDVVARHHLMYDSVNAERFHDWMVCSIEKNRSGESHIDIEFRKRFARGHYDPHGAMVNEKLVDDRIHSD
jgi:replicative DNA helicase